jgi:hypothetical protein
MGARTGRTKAGVGSATTGGGFLGLFLGILLAGFLVAVSAPPYLDYVRDAKTVEARFLARSLWTAIQSHAMASCGAPSRVSQGYSSAGFDNAGSTVPARWRVVAAGGATVTLDCTTGTISADQDVFTIAGIGSDVDSIRVRLAYATAARPPMHLTCSVDSGSSFKQC